MSTDQATPGSDDFIVSQQTLTFPPRNQMSGITPGIPGGPSALPAGVRPNLAPTNPTGIPVMPTAHAPAPPAAPQPFHISTELQESDRNAAFLPVALPSNFVFYPFKEVHVRLVTGLQQAKFSQAAKSKNFRYTVEAVNVSFANRLNAMDLVLQDFFYVAYFLRLASYTRSQFRHVGLCTNPEHLKRIAEGKAKPESIQALAVINRTDLTETTLPGIPAVPPALAALGLRLGPAYIRDVVVLDELEDEASKTGDQDTVNYLGNAACYLDAMQTDPRWAKYMPPAEDTKTVLRPLTLKERMEIVADLPAEVITSLNEDWILPISSFGIKEEIVTNCKECGAAVRTEVRIAPHHFL